MMIGLYCSAEAKHLTNAKQRSFILLKKKQTKTYLQVNKKLPSFPIASKTDFSIDVILIIKHQP